MLELGNGINSLVLHSLKASTGRCCKAEYYLILFYLFAIENTTV